MTNTKNPLQAGTVAQYIAECIAASGMTQQEVATAIGMPNANAISMLTTGSLKLPINRIGAIAKALGIDATHLLRLTLREYSPDLLGAIEDVLERPLISVRGAALIDSFRMVTGDRDERSVVIERDGLLEVLTF